MFISPHTSPPPNTAQQTPMPGEMTSFNSLIQAAVVFDLQKTGSLFIKYVSADAVYEKLGIGDTLILTADATFMFYNITLTAVISD